MKIPSLSPVVCLLSLSTATMALAEAAKPIISEDFENVPVGEIPKGFTKTGAVSVANDVAHSGKQSLRLEPALKGGRTITKPAGPELAALGGQFWGRLYFKVKLPVPEPIIPEGKTSGIIHTTLVSGKAVSPLFNDPIDIRLLTNVLTSAGTFSYMYNVQPKGGARKEFGSHGKGKFKYNDEWTLAEWSVDYATQSYHLYINGEEIKDAAVEKGAGKFEGAEIPAVFDSLTFGWTNYQPASGEGFTAWIDDLALGKERLGPVPGAVR
jgi:hypothetical protein